MGRNKKIFIFFGAVFFLCAVFWLVPHLGFAADAPKEETPSGFFGYMFQAIQSAISWLLYKVFQVLVWVAAAAIGLFGFAINADLISGPTGLLNQPVIYELWKFIRDFCNIFFILMLLIGAFSMVFQLSSYNAKKTLLSIILAALFVNFSFPLSRVLIDVSNVPTYFFAQQTLGSSGGKSVSQVAGGALLSATGMEKLLLGNKGKDAEVPTLIVAIVFIFMFAVALCILAVLFVIRVVSLVVLVIFSPIGFMKFVPGISGYADEWWKKLVGNLVFAPAAMLMLLVSVRFAEVIQSYNTTISSEASTVGGDAGLASILGVMMRSAIPIILIMMTISVALSSRVAGVGIAKKVSDKMMGWGKKASFLAAGGFAGGLAGAGMYLGGRRIKGTALGLKERYIDNSLLSAKTRESRRKDKEEEWKGYGRGGADGRKAALETIQNRKILDTVKNNKDRNVSNSELLNNLNSGDGVAAAAAALSLSENKAISNPDDLRKAAKALEVFGKNAPRETSKLLENARPGAFKMDADKIKGLLNSETFAQRDTDGKAIRSADGSYAIDESSMLYRDFSSKMRSEGQVKSFADYRIQAEIARVAATGVTPNEAKIRKDIYNDTIGKLSSIDLAKQGSIHDAVGSDKELANYMKEYAKNRKNYEKTMERMSAVDQEKWNKADIAPAPDATTSSDTDPSSAAAAQSQREKLREVGQRNNRRP
ncbi:MAG: hypothetical protein KBB51_00115 [Candidatus Moranbacteria bacterium]|jgi:hypothetical protein|nr:hypothetical protein [Candidatus Moranbacteria bacterium]